MTTPNSEKITAVDVLVGLFIIALGSFAVMLFLLWYNHSILHVSKIGSCVLDVKSLEVIHDVSNPFFHCASSDTTSVKTENTTWIPTSYTKISLIS